MKPKLYQDIHKACLLALKALAKEGKSYKDLSWVSWKENGGKHGLSQAMSNKKG